MEPSGLPGRTARSGAAPALRLLSRRNEKELCSVKAIIKRNPASASIYLLKNTEGCPLALQAMFSATLLTHNPRHTLSPAAAACLGSTPEPAVKVPSSCRAWRGASQRPSESAARAGRAQHPRKAGRRKASYEGREEKTSKSWEFFRAVIAASWLQTCCTQCVDIPLSSFCTVLNISLSSMF